MNDKNSVSFVAFEAEMMRQERTVKRLWGVSIVAILALAATNLMWFVKVVM